jgi:hypothetical protein
MQQMSMMSFTPQQGTVGRINTYVPPPAAQPAYAPPAWAPPQYQQPYQQQGGRFTMQQPGGRGGRSRGGRIRRARGGGQGETPAPMPFIGGQHVIPYIPGGAQQQMHPPPEPTFFQHRQTIRESECLLRMRI